jgi:hypothetical protein
MSDTGEADGSADAGITADEMDRRLGEHLARFAIDLSKSQRMRLGMLIRLAKIAGRRRAVEQCSASLDETLKILERNRLDRDSV